jgi:hypothetical protein
MRDIDREMLCIVSCCLSLSRRLLLVVWRLDGLCRCVHAVPAVTYKNVQHLE